jgi:hypothetical protein
MRDGVFAICLRTNPYTFLGDRPLELAPGAGLDTALTAVVLHRLDLATLLPLAGRALAGQGIEGRRGVTVSRELTALTLTADRPLPYQVDGDHLGASDHFELRYEPDALSLILPVAADPGVGDPDGVVPPRDPSGWVEVRGTRAARSAPGSDGRSAAARRPGSSRPPEHPPAARIRRVRPPEPTDH